MSFREDRQRIGNDTVVSYPAIMVLQSDLDRLSSWAIKHRLGDSIVALTHIMNAAEELDERKLAEQEALDFVLQSPEEASGMLGLHSFTVAHLRIPRVEVTAYESMDEYHNVVAQMIVDKAFSAFVTATMPVHDKPGGPDANR